MRPSSPEQATVAAELARDLRDYDSRLCHLLQERWDAGQYRVLCDQFDHMQMRSQLLPRLATTWTELLISRVELAHALWSLTRPCRINGRVMGRHAQHRVLVREALRTCEQYVAPKAAAPA
jgi:hypothetical protein